SVLAPIFFALLILSPVVSPDSDCFWQGTAPICAPDDCPQGTTEIVRSEWFQHVEDRTLELPPFGESCEMRGDKVLCCKNSVVRKDITK
ncbi:hypothetical protein PMAYCL1PPCAC_25377, partial [Pristionchus mayeri]